MAKAIKAVAGAAVFATASWSGYVKYLEYSDYKAKRILNPQGRLFFVSRLLFSCPLFFVVARHQFFSCTTAVSTTKSWTHSRRGMFCYILYLGMPKDRSVELFLPCAYHVSFSCPVRLIATTRIKFSKCQSHYRISFHPTHRWTLSSISCATAAATTMVSTTAQ